MGDRCYMTATVQRKDLARWTEIGFTQEECVDLDTCDPVEMVDSEANYGHYDDLVEAAKDGLIFIAQHCEGGSYGACLYVGLDGKLIEQSSNSEYEVVVPLDDDGNINPKCLQHAREFIAARKKAQKLMAEVAVPCETK